MLSLAVHPDELHNDIQIYRAGQSRDPVHIYIPQRPDRSEFERYHHHNRIGLFKQFGEYRVQFPPALLQYRVRGVDVANLKQDEKD